MMTIKENKHEVGTATIAMNEIGEAANHALQGDVKETKETASSHKMRSMKVRLPVEVWEIVKEIAADNAISQAELVRMALSDKLNKYLNSVRFIDQTQADEIKKIILTLLGEVHKVQIELNRIGTNYNQEIVLLHLHNMNINGEISTSRYRVEKEKIQRKTVNLSESDLEQLMYRFETALKEAGRLLCTLM